MKRKVIALGLTLAAGGLASGAPACRKDGAADGRAPLGSLAEALRPEAVAAGLRKLGGAHLRGTTRLSVSAAGAGAATADAGAGVELGGAVTTTTDVWLDRTGNYRIVETNDRDGGREIVLHGRDLYVALRYGKMIRRVAEQPEPERLLQEALGGPWAAWEVAAPFATAAPAGSAVLGGIKATEYRVTKGAAAPPAGPPPASARAWRATVAVQKLDGRLWIDDATGALVKAELAIAFAGTRNGQPDGPRVEGAIDVRTAVDGVAGTEVDKPAAEELALRQRTVPEQKDLLGDLMETPVAAPAASSKKAKRP